MFSFGLVVLPVQSELLVWGQHPCPPPALFVLLPVSVSLSSSPSPHSDPLVSVYHCPVPSYCETSDQSLEHVNAVVTAV